MPIVEDSSWTWAGVFNLTGLRYLGASNLTDSNDRYQARPKSPNTPLAGGDQVFPRRKRVRVHAMEC